MSHSPLLSIVIPTFNSSLYIERCLESIINQSFKDFEVIAIDDVSTDNTLEVLSNYQKRFSSMKILRLENKRLAGGARNVGLELAKGKYISFIDSDDWIDTNYYHYHIQSILEHDSDISICGVKREYEASKNSSVRYQYDVSNVISGIYAISLLSKVIDQDVSISAIVCNKIFKSTFIKSNDLRFIENCVNEDDVFVFNSFLKSKRISLINKTYYHLYQRKKSVSRGFSKKHIDDLFFAFAEIKKILSEANAFESMKKQYYAFFEKCFSYVIESMQNSIQDDVEISSHFKYAYSLSRDIIPVEDFVDYCGPRRIVDFFRT